MKNMKDAIETFSFSLLKDELKKKARTEIGKKKIAQLEPYHDPYFLKETLDLLKEGILFYASFGAFPFVNSMDLSSLLLFAKKGGTLSPKDFSMILMDIEAKEKTLDFIKKSEGPFPLLKEYIRDFKDVHYLKSAITKVISPTLSIYDDASGNLRSIRSSKRKLESDVKTKVNEMVNRYQDILSDKTYTLRNGHFVLPIKSSEKNKITGIIHDVSDSGMTIFIEPSSLVELNNKILLLGQQENDEIERILHELTLLVVQEKEALLTNNQMLGELDFLQAKADYALETDSYVPHISKTPIIHLKGARHPFIDPKKVVKNDFYLDENHRILVLTGPNAGGKTVAMKCVGLLCYMFQCGLAIPTDEEATLSMFDYFLCDIGDQQSISDALSTFSGHMESLKQILTLSTSSSLVLIDEMGTGTDPLEGEALAIAFLKAFLKKGSFTMISSHFSGVKAFALSEEKLLVGSMLFDEEKLEPKYILKIGVPGNSYALEVARRHGIPQAVIEEASSYLKEKNQDEMSQKIAHLEALIFETEKQKTVLEEKEKKIAKKEEEISTFYAHMDQEKEKLERKFKEEKEERLEQVEEEVQAILQKLKTETLQYHEALSYKKRLDALKEEEEEKEEEIANTPIQIDDYVKVNDSQIVGRVVRLKGNSLTLLTPEGMSIQTKLNRVKKVMPLKAPSKHYSPSGDPTIMASIKPEHNVIGMHVDEALESVEKYLDNARVRHLKTVRIIHGSGTGALRNAIHQYLKNQDFVESYRLGGGSEGGVGATVVTLK